MKDSKFHQAPITKMRGEGVIIIAEEMNQVVKHEGITVIAGRKRKQNR